MVLLSYIVFNFVISIYWYLPTHELLSTFSLYIVMIVFTLMHKYFTTKRGVNWFFKLLIYSYTWKTVFMESLTNWQKGV